LVTAAVAAAALDDEAPVDEAEADVLVTMVDAPVDAPVEVVAAAVPVLVGAAVEVLIPVIEAAAAAGRTRTSELST
jgi:hypothetical protein